MPSPVILVAGTWGRGAAWWRPASELAALLRAAGCTIVGTDDEDPYTWTTDLDGLSGDDVDWEEAGKALVWYAHLKCPPVGPGPQPVSIVAHSHGGQVVAKAARHGLLLDRVVTVATPPRHSLEPDYTALRQQSQQWTHLWTDEPFVTGWQRRGQFEWSWTGLKRGLWPVTEMQEAHANVYEPGSSHAGLMDVGLWAARRWSRFLAD